MASPPQHILRSAIHSRVAIVEINGGHFRILPVPLGTVRPFVISDIRLEDLVNTDDFDLLKAVEEALAEQIIEMIKSINEDEKFQNRDRPALPLIRLCVEHSGFPRINSSKFGHRFANQAANPEDLLLFYKQAKGTRKGTSNAQKVSVDPEMLDDRTVDEAPPIHAILNALIGRHPLAVLPESKFADAIEEFVEKKSLTSIKDFIDNSLLRASISVKAACANKNVSELSKAEIERLLRHHHDLEVQNDASRVKTKREYEQEILAGLDLDAIDRITNKKVASKSAGRSKKNDISSEDEFDGFDDDDEDDEPPPVKKPVARRGKSAKAAAATPARSRVAKLEFEPVDDAMEESEDAIESPRSAQSRRGRRAVENDDDDDDDAPARPAAKRRRVETETAAAAPVSMGNRNKNGELSFITTAAKPARGKAASSKPATSRARKTVVDLIED